MINSQSQITIDNTLKDKFSNSPTPTDKVKTGANINKVIKTKVKLSQLYFKLQRERERIR